MVVGVCSITLALPGVDSLKGKRSIVKRLLERSRNRFNVAVAEVGELDSKRRAVLGLAVVSNDGRHANAMLDRITAFIAGASEAVISGRKIELIPLSEDFGTDRPLLDFDQLKYFEP